MYKLFGFLLLLVHFARCYNIVPISMPSTNFIAAPVWDSCKQSVYCVDFVSPNGVNAVYRYDTRTGQTYGAQIAGETSPSFIWPVEGVEDQFVVGFLNAMKVIQWDGLSPTATINRTLFTAYGHFNYAQTDKKGRLFFGTLNNTIFCSSPPDYATYRLSNGKFTTIFSNIEMTTGLAFDMKRNKFYHGDACRYQILEFDYDCKTGDICNGRVVYDFKNSGVVPYPLILGLNVDRNGLLYCTLYETSEMWIIDPRTSTVVNKIRFPSKGVSDIIFGGSNNDQMFVTATHILVDAYGGKVLEVRPQDPTLYRIDGLGAQGYDTTRARLNDVQNNVCYSKK